MTDTRITREAIEVIGSVVEVSDARVTRQAVEVIGTIIEVSDARVTRIAVEVIGAYSDGPPPAPGFRREAITITYT
tara:strand:+ start:2894 stop:3121 length:228 start_codon:yes stop_codon:yes gene_type:complete